MSGWIANTARGIAPSMATLVLATLSPAASDAAVAPTPGDAGPAYLDPARPAEARARDLVGRMTPEEKASQFTNQARAVPRLEVAAYNWWSEALHGVARNGYATVFPEPVGLAATFDPDAIHAMGEAIGTEARAKWNLLAAQGGRPRIYQGLDFWSPNINIFRDPRWGRGQETYGEDPFLTGRMGSAFVTGMQGDDPDHYRVAATAKHFAVHSGPEPSRHEADVHVSRHDAEDTYLPAFRELVVGAHVASVMCAYNRVDGQPACASDFLLDETLRGRWGFKGYVVSDCDAIADIQRGHHYVRTLAEAAAVSLKHGVDNDCTQFNAPEGSADHQPYLDAMRRKLVDPATVDASLQRLFTARMKLGLFDPPGSGPYARTPASELNSPAHRALARRLAAESLVLLKNDGVLPIKPAVRTIAVVGPLADQVDVMLGNYNGRPTRPVTVLDGIHAAFPRARVVYAPGTRFLRTASTIPASALSTRDGRPGLQAQFRRGPGFTGAPALSRRDPELFYDRDMTPVIDADVISARWTGRVTAPETGEYAVGLAGSDARLWVDGVLQVATGAGSREPKLATLRLEAGRPRDIRIEQSPAKGLEIRLVWNRVVDRPMEQAMAAVRRADVVIAAVGITSALEGEEMTVTVPGFKGGDRTSLDLPAQEEALLEAVHGAGKPLAVVLMNGSALAVNWAATHADAILEAWYPGEQGGAAVGRALAGSDVPCGRLPVTVYTGVDQLPPFEDYAMAGRTYRYFAGKPLYPFGHGLSYTRFAYDGLKLSQASLAAGAPLVVEAQVRNIGRVAADEVAQLYLGFPRAPGLPLRALRGFTRVHLEPGRTRSVRFDLDARALSGVTEAGERVVAAGDYVVSVGGGQPGTDAPTVAAPLSIHGTARVDG